MAANDLSLGQLNGPWLRLFKFSMGILPALITVNIGFLAWVGISLVDLRERVAVVEATRFTTKDGMALWQEVGTKVDREEFSSALAAHMASDGKQ